MTNGDIIRQMSNEELAVFLSNVECDIKEAHKDGEITLYSGVHMM